MAGGDTGRFLKYLKEFGCELLMGAMDFMQYLVRLIHCISLGMYISVDFVHSPYEEVFGLKHDCGVFLGS